MCVLQLNPGIFTFKFQTGAAVIHYITAAKCLSVMILQRWLDPSKPIRKQLKSRWASIADGTITGPPSHAYPPSPPFSGGSPHTFNFRVKFFVSDPNKLQEEYTRWEPGGSLDPLTAGEFSFAFI